MAQRVLRDGILLPGDPRPFGASPQSGRAIESLAGQPHEIGIRFGEEFRALDAAQNRPHENPPFRGAAWEEVRLEERSENREILAGGHQKPYPSGFDRNASARKAKATMATPALGISRSALAAGMSRSRMRAAASRGGVEITTASYRLVSPLANRRANGADAAKSGERLSASAGI